MPTSGFEGFPADTLHFLEGAVLAVTFDKDDLYIVAELRQTLYGRLDVAPLIARRDHNRRRLQVIIGNTQRSADNIMTKRQLPDDGQNADKTIDQTSNPEQRYRHQQPPFRFDRINIGKHRKRGHIIGRKNILLRIWHAPAHCLREAQNRLPEMGEVSNDNARVAYAQRMQLGEKRLTIIERANRVLHQNEIERSLQGADRFRVFRIANLKLQFGMQAPRLFDHARTEIDPNSV